VTAMKIAGLLITLFFLLVSIPQIRLYRRRGLKGALLRGIGGIAGAIGCFGLTFALLSSWNYPIMPSLFLIIISLLLYIVSFPILYIKESGLLKELENTTYWQRFTGNVPIVKYEKRPDPTAKRQVFLLLGVVMMAGGIIGAVFFKLTMNYFSTGTIFSFIVGLLFVIFSLVYLNKNKGQHK